MNPKNRLPNVGAFDGDFHGTWDSESRKKHHLNTKHIHPKDPQSVKKSTPGYHIADFDPTGFGREDFPR